MALSLAPRGDLIQVAARDDAVARVEAGGHARDVEHVDVGRQPVVDAREQRGRRQRGVRIDVRDLAQRVHARVRPSRPIRLERRAAAKARKQDGLFHRPRPIGAWLSLAAPMSSIPVV